jgi:hypothetical protein
MVRVELPQLVVIRALDNLAWDYRLSLVVVSRVIGLRTSIELEDLVGQLQLP